MTNDQNASGTPPPGGKARRRPAPMIELEATEIESKPMADSTATSASSEPAGAAPAPTDPAAPEPPPPQSAAAAPASEEPPQAHVASAHAAAAAAESEAAAAKSDDTPPRRGSVAWLPPGVPWQPIGAGVAGGAVVLVALLIASLVPGRDAGPPAP